MAISANSKILASDVSGKIDTAGTGLSKSGTTLSLATVVTAGNAGPTANATLTYGGTFTVPYVTYDAYGRVTGRTNRTMTMPSAPSSTTTASKATAIASTSFIAVRDGYSGSTVNYGGGTVTYSGTTAKYTFPIGGNWRYFLQQSGMEVVPAQIAGGKTINFADTHHENGTNGIIFGFRYA